MARGTEPKALLKAEDIARRVQTLAQQIAPRIDDETVCVCLLTGGLWFAADLTRALHDQGREVLFDALWLESYGDNRVSGAMRVRAGLQRPVSGRPVLILDDVFDSGQSLAEAVKIAKAAGAARVLTCVFARKPWSEPRALDPDFVGWEAPAAFLVGYGMDDAGRGRGNPDITSI